MNQSVGSKEIGVLYICTIFLTARTFVAPIAWYCTEQGYPVYIACSVDPTLDGPESLKNPQIPGCSLTHVSIPRAIRPFHDLIAIWKIYRLICRVKPKIVHTQTSKAGFVGRIAAWFAGVPIVIHTAHAFPFHPYLPPLTRWWYIFLERWAAKCSSKLHFLKKDPIRVILLSSLETVTPSP